MVPSPGTDMTIPTMSCTTTVSEFVFVVTPTLPYPTLPYPPYPTFLLSLVYILSLPDPPIRPFLRCRVISSMTTVSEFEFVINPTL